MEVVLYSIFITGLFTLIFLGLSMVMARIVTRESIINFDTLKTKVKEYLIWISDRNNWKKALVLILGLLLWIIGVTLSIVWGMALITPHCKQSKILFTLSMPGLYIILVPFMYCVIKKWLDKKLALYTLLFFILSVACTFMAVKYVDAYGLL